MSMNLTCHSGKKKIELWQTPTHITWMCLSINPKTKKPDGGMEGVRRRYLLWLQAKLDGVWSSEEELNEMRATVADYSAEIREVKRPSFSYE